MEPQGRAERRSPITVALVDDEQMLRDALSRALTDAGLEVVCHAGNAADAIELVVALRPDVVLMGIASLGSDGVRTIEQLGLLAPASRILVLTHSEENRVIEAIVAGASGYMLKTAPTEAIVAAVRATSAGQSALSPQIAGKLLQRVRERDVPVTTGAEDAAHAIRVALTERELEIFTRLASGRNNRQIADELGLSTNTIANHISSILEKLHLENRIQAAVHAVRTGIA